MLLVKKKLHLPSTFSALTPSNCDYGHCYCTSVVIVILSFLRISSSQAPSHTIIEKTQRWPALTFLSNGLACHSSAYLNCNGCSYVKQQNNRSSNEIWVQRRRVVLKKFPLWFARRVSRVDPKVAQTAGTDKEENSSLAISDIREVYFLLPYV